MTDFSSFPLGSCIGGIPVRMHWTCLVLFALQVGTAYMASRNVYIMALLAALYGPVLLATILVHEYGHAFMNKRLGGSVESILLWPLGGLVYLGPTIGPVLNDFWVSVAGPLTHIIQVAVWCGVWWLTANGETTSWSSQLDLEQLSSSFPGFCHQLAIQAIIFNIILFCFNLFVPAYPLDGGHCLAALLVQAGLKVKTTAKIVAGVSVCLSMLMIAYAIYDWLIVTTSGVGSLLFLLVAFFLLRTAVDLYKAATADNSEVIYSHPLFRRPCYREMDQSRGNPGACYTSSAV